jgi:cell division protein FtsI/penicillin-binding protein 2
MINELYKLAEEVRVLENRSKMSAMQRLIETVENDYDYYITNNNLQVYDGELYIILEKKELDGMTVAPKRESSYPCDETLENVFAYRIKTNGAIDENCVREVSTEAVPRDNDPAEGEYCEWVIGNEIKVVE